jgi:hypothetical protein
MSGWKKGLEFEKEGIDLENKDVNAALQKHKLALQHYQYAAKCRDFYFRITFSLLHAR